MQTVRKKRPPRLLSPFDARLVRIVLQRPGVVRAELAAQMGVSQARAAGAARDLVRAGALRECGQAPSKGGRPATRLLAAPSLAYAYAHSVSNGSLRSSIVDAAGCASKPLTTALSDPKNIGRHLDEIETLLAGGNGFNVVGSTVVLPGSPGPDNRTIGKAPWLHGAVTLELERPMLTNAEALLRAESTREPDLLDHLALAIDLNDGASAVVRTPEGASVLLNLMGTPGPEHVYMRRSFAKFVKENAARPDSSIAIHVRQGAPEVEALRLSESEGDVVACTLVDETSDSVAKYIGWLARMIRPVHLVVGSWLFAAGILDPNDISRRVRRLCPPGVVQRLAFRCIEGDEGSHLAGGGLCAIERWLQQMESDA